jgi:GNAT superfamily N-acetyltransferase
MPRPQQVTTRALQLTARPLRPDDRDRLCRMFHRLSPETRYRRFFSPITKIEPKALDHLINVDHFDREALVALWNGEIVGVARWDRLRDDPTAAEVAIVVEDEWQGHGVGRFLLRCLAPAAADAGIERFTASVLASNPTPVRLARSLAPLVEVSFDDGETQLVIPLDPAVGPSAAA